MSNDARWEAIIEANYELPEDASLNRLTEQLLRHLGSTDPRLREVYAYNILARWIVHYRYHTVATLRDMIDILLKQLGRDLGLAEGDAVFLRSYSAALLALIMYRDSREHFLDEIEVRAVLERAVTYLKQERDTRGYITDKGFAGALSHGANLLKFLAYSDLLAPADMRSILDTVFDRLIVATTVPFQHDEEDRLASAVLAVLLRDDLNSQDVADWLEQFVEWRSANPAYEETYDPELNTIYQNIKHFLLVLYAQIKLERRLPISIESIEPDLLRAIEQFTV